MGILAFIFAFKARKALDNAWNESDQSRDKLRGRGLANIGMIAGFIAVLLGIFYSAVFLYFTKAMKAPVSEPVGNVQIYYYGNNEYDEIAVKTILLPDSTLMTRGHRIPHDKDSNKNALVLLKTGLDGQHIWEKAITGANGRLTVTLNNDILFCYTRPNPNGDQLTTTLETLYLLLDGDSLRSRSYTLGNNATVTECIQTNDGNCIIVGTYQSDSTATAGVTYALKVDNAGDSLWLCKYPKTLTGNVAAITQTQDWGIAMAGWIEVEDAARYKFYLLKIDGNGQTVWNNPGDETFDIGSVDITEDQDGSLIVLGNRWDENRSMEGKLMKFDADGGLIWSKPVSKNGYYCIVTGFIPKLRDDGWLVTGWVPRQESLMTFSSQEIQHWDTYYIALIDMNGNIRHAFDGVKVSFAAWGVTRIDDDYCIITGFGNRGEKGRYGKLSDEDIGIIHYRL